MGPQESGSSYQILHSSNRFPILILINGESEGDESEKNRIFPMYDKFGF
jgi:hypothetical protein